MISGIQGRAIFTQLRKEGQRVRGGALRMTYCQQPDPRPMVAFAFGRKFGNAVQRNRARRRLRAAFADAWNPATQPPGAYLISGRRSVLTDEYPSLVDDVRQCLEQLGLEQLGPERPSREPTSRDGSDEGHVVGVCAL
ncbi:MAG: ribonuclease P protein component [Acidimicrobiales bacterium]